jgi:hypothetical protein
MENQQYYLLREIRFSSGVLVVYVGENSKLRIQFN